MGNDLRKSQQIKVEEPLESTVRLDHYIVNHLQLMNRSRIKTADLQAWELDSQGNRKVFKLGKSLRGGEVLELQWKEDEPSYLEPQAMDLEILHEDGHVIVLNKARGVVVHPGAGCKTGTLVQGLLAYSQELARGFALKEGETPPDWSFRPGIVHRLDKDTTGVMITAKDPETLEYLAGLFQNRQVEKIYWALVKGIPLRRKGRIETPIGRDPHNRKRFAVTSPGKGKRAVTDYRVMKSWKIQGAWYSLLSLRLLTGRTHQIRVHCAHLDCPLVGDPIYSRSDKRVPATGLMLHARALGLVLPGDDETTRFVAPLPQDFRSVLENLDTQYVVTADDDGDGYRG